MSESNLDFSVNTKAARKEIEALRREIVAFQAELQQVNAAVGRSGQVDAKAAAQQKVLTAAIRTRQVAIEALTATEQKSAAQMARLTMNYGKASVTFKGAADAAATGFINVKSSLDQLSKNPNTLLGYALEMKQLEDAQKAAAREAERSRKIRDANETRAIRQMIREDERLNNARVAQAKASLAALTNAQTAQRAKELAALRASITERHAVELAGEKRREATRRQQAARDLAFDRSTLAQRLAILEQAERAMAAGQSRSTIMRMVGRNAFSMLPNIAGMRDAVKAQADLTQGFGSGTGTLDRYNNQMLRHNNLMREGHSLARGFAGPLGMMWLTWGSLAPLIAGASVAAAGRSTYEVGKDVEFRLAMLEALGNAPTTVDQMMPAVHGSMLTPLDAAKGLQELAQAGLNTNEALLTLPTTLRLATLGEMSVADAALTATSALSTFNLEVDQAGRVGDVFAKAAAISNTTVEGVAEAMKQAGAGAAAYGVSIEETVAQIAVLAQSGIRGSAAGTAIKNAMQEIHAPTKKAAAAMKEVGLEIYNSDGSARNYMEVLRDLQGVYLNLNEQGRANLLGQMFNQRSRRAIQIYLQDLQRLEDAYSNLQESEGFLLDANLKLLDTVEGASNRMQSVLQQSLVKAFEELKPSIRATLLALEEAFGSETFVNVVTALGQGIAGTTRVVTEHAGTLLTMVLAYSTARVAIMALTAVQARAAAQERVATLQKALTAAGINRETAALIANTAAQNANNAGKAVAGTRLGGFLSVATRTIPVINWLTVGLTTAVGLYQAFATNTDRASGSASEFTSRLGPATQALAEYNKQLREQLELEGLRDGKPATIRRTQDELDVDVGHQNALKIQIDAITESMSNLRAQYDANNEAMRTPGGFVDPAVQNQITLELVQQNQRLEELKKNYEIVTGRVKETYGAIAEGERLREASIQSNAASASRSLRDIFERQLKSTSETNDKLPGITQRFEELNARYAAGAIKATEYHEALEGLNHELTASGGSFGAGGDDGGGGGLAARINVSNIMQEMSGLKQLAQSERDFRLKMARDEADVGIISMEELATKRAAIYKDYTNEVVRLADNARGKIAGMDKGSEELKGLQSQRVMIELNNELAMAGLRERQEEQQRRQQYEFDAQTLNAKVDSELSRKRSELIENEYKNRRELEMEYTAGYMRPAYEARYAAEQKYQDMLDKRREKLALMEKLQPGFSATPTGRAMLDSIGKIEQDQIQAGMVAFDSAQRRMQEASSLTSNLQRAFSELTTNALTSGDIIKDSFVHVGTTIGDALGNAAATGKLSIRDMVADITANLAKMWVSQGFQVLMGLAGRGIASMFGPVTPNTSYAPDIGNFFGSAIGNAFDRGSHLKRYAKGGAFTNSIATGTSIAPMAMFGEAGPEAIMPLTRMSNGNLGVEASMGGGGQMISIVNNMQINVSGTDSSFTVEDRTALAQNVAQVASIAAKDEIAKSVKRGGIIHNMMQGGK